MAEPLVSIIIPVYNAATHVAKCIETVRRQTYRNIEILLVNDGSEDVSLPICDMYARIDPRITVINRPNSGVSATRNYAIEHAHGDYLQFVDSDDWLDTDALAKVLDRLRLLLENSQESLDWLNSLGTNITRPLSNYQVATEDGSSLGAAIVKAMSSALEQSSVDLRLDTEAVEILTEDGAVTGVRVRDAGGEYSILADSVVLASGGFVSGTEAVEKYAPEWAGLPSTSAAGSTGEMFGLVEQIGGVLSNMDVVRLNPSVHSENGVNSSLSAARAEGGIIVNQQGLRFCNDYYPDYTTLSKWMVEQEGDYVYILIDQTAMDNSKRLQGFKDMGYFLEADTLEELAEKMGVPADNLVKTVEAYQEAVRTGVDEFGRTNNLSIDFSNPPYYAVTTSPGLQVSLGGILVDDTMRVQKQDGTSFDNLYAVGECADDGLFGCAPTNINITFGKMVADQILGR